MVDLNLLKVLVMSNSGMASHRSAMSMLTYQQACFFFSMSLTTCAGPKSNSSSLKSSIGVP
jgi:hypothetical protein